MKIKKNLRFSSKINTKQLQKSSITNKMKSELNFHRTKNLNSQNDTVDNMWEKLVLYYLSRLKGLCDWRGYVCTPNSGYSRSDRSASSELTELLETEVVKNVTKLVTKNVKISQSQKADSYLNDTGSYMAAGYEEGKQQAAKIVIRSLRFGLLTGILKREGSVYRIRPKYMGKFLPPAFNKRGRLPRLFKFQYKTEYNRNNDKKKKRNVQNKHKYDWCPQKKKAKQVHLAKVLYNCEDKFVSHSKRQQQSTNSFPNLYSVKSSRSTIEYDPVAKRRGIRLPVRKPVIPKPPRKKRTKSQTKSPTPSRSQSKKTTGPFNPRKLSMFIKRLSNAHSNCRDSSVLSSLSSESSLWSNCNKNQKVTVDSEDSKQESLSMKSNEEDDSSNQ